MQPSRVLDPTNIAKNLCGWGATPERPAFGHFSCACAEKRPTRSELAFYNVHTDERLRVRYRDESGRYDFTALDDINHILLCHHTGEVATMDPRVIEHINLVQKPWAVQGRFMSFPAMGRPEYNAILFKRSRRAARSQSPCRRTSSRIFPGVIRVECDHVT